jgi:hypothetical protein
MRSHEVPWYFVPRSTKVPHPYRGGTWDGTWNQPATATAQPTGDGNSNHRAPAPQRLLSDASHPGPAHGPLVASGGDAPADPMARPALVAGKL